MSTATLAKAPAKKAISPKRPVTKKPAAYTRPGEQILPARRQTAHIRDTLLGDAFNVLSCYSGATEMQIMLEVTYAAVTNVYELFPAVPRLAILANSPSSGKTVNGQITAALSRRPEIMGAFWTVASLYGTLETEKGALLFIDEVDKLLGEDGLRSGEKANAVRAILNDGYQPEGICRKVVGRSVIKISTYGPAIASGLGNPFQADTLERCLVLHLRKNKPSSVYVAPRHKAAIVEIGEKIANHLAKPEATAFMSMAALSDATGVGDDGRFCLIMTPMCAVADYFGYGKMFRAGIGEVQANLQVDPPRPMHEWLLTDLRECWPADAKMMTPEEAIRCLHGHPEHRWNRVLTMDQAGLLMLGRYLGKQGIESTPRGGRGQANTRVYLRADVQESQR